MTNLQLLLSISIPGVLVLLGWLQTNTQLSRVESAVDRVSSDLVTLRTDVHREMVTLRNDLNRDLTSLRNDLNRDIVGLRDSIHRDMIILHERVAVVETKNA